MSARDELAKLMFVTDNDSAADPDHEWEMTTRHNPMYSEYAFAMADAILAAGYRKPRAITTAEELDALPVGSVIRTSEHEDHLDPRVAVKTGFWKSESEWEVADSDDFCLDSGELDDLPATVLHEPEAS